MSILDAFLHSFPAAFVLAFLTPICGKSKNFKNKDSASARKDSDSDLKTAVLNPKIPQKPSKKPNNHLDQKKTDVSPKKDQNSKQQSSAVSNKKVKSTKKQTDVDDTIGDAPSLPVAIKKFMKVFKFLKNISTPTVDSLHNLKNVISDVATAKPNQFLMDDIHLHGTQTLDTAAETQVVSTLRQPTIA
ncbi:hypothetical protein DICVIV_10564 [Dictyocaulus viviparus]|uniref:Uncharacterized protein n=1 Tax=Dictyocaulus viviparus TaxID=29172 RepID=A0A0D8XFQ3_DICVI|nr:hypothetical protein DICVIV_10564 [Dictyocaulus viviparus]